MGSCKADIKRLRKLQDKVIDAEGKANRLADKINKKGC